MTSNVDRPTAVANTLAAAVTDTFEEEERPGSDILKTENTARNRVRREGKFNKVRNLALQRLYDGTFFITWHVCAAGCSFIRAFLHAKIPAFFSPIRPYHGGELNGSYAVPLLVAEVSCVLCTICNAVFDAICGLCERSELPEVPGAEQPQQPQTETTNQRMHAPSIAPIGTPKVRCARVQAGIEAAGGADGLACPMP